jgi:hypothetical protein
LSIGLPVVVAGDHGAVVIVRSLHLLLSYILHRR